MSSSNLTSLSSIEAHTLSEARATLLAWYDDHKRDLPWRDIQNPWATWVSEIMLQQTRVSSVLDYFDRFMTRFPTPHALAEAEWDEVAGYWAGLGYYRRAKNLWRGAREVVERHAGEIPDDPEAVRALTGVGAYTAGAILSIAFGQPAPIVDGNVARVFARLYRIEEEIESAPSQRALWSLAEAWAQGERPGDLNQALMELGATICMPKSPTCLICPLHTRCRVALEADPTALPRKRKKRRALPRESYVVFALRSLEDTPRYWVTKRLGEGLLGGLLALPQRAREPNEAREGTPPDASELAEAWMSWLDDTLGSTSPTYATLRECTWTLEVLERAVEHRFTHKRWVWWVTQVSGAALTELLEALSAHDVGRLMSAAELDQAGLGGPSLKSLRALGAPLRARRGSGT